MSASNDSLIDWLHLNGGYLQPDVQVTTDEANGVHWRANSRIRPGTALSTAPHCVALSYLNALVDDAHPTLKSARGSLAIENIGFFYLMTQYINREKSFWKPYLDTLPEPDSNLSTPLWFEEVADVAWLEGTDVHHSALGRKEVYDKYWREGVALLQSAGVDTGPYTWKLFLWAVTMFTSRSFSSRAIAPSESKYWTSYKTGPDGRRQTVLLDMSHTRAEDLDFPVLFPMQDVANHHHDARVDWTFDPGRFTISTNDEFEPGQQILNSYGPKANHELLLGYGFCIPDNPHDCVLLTLKAPPEDLQQHLRPYHPGYFSADTGAWSSEKATFGIRCLTRPNVDDSEGMWEQLPEPLLELMMYILRHERDLDFKFIEHPWQFLQGFEGKRYLPHIARMIVESLAPKLEKLRSVSLPERPGNIKQQYAAIYRNSQINILQSVSTSLRAFTRSFRNATRQDASYIPGKAERRFVFVTLDEIVSNFYLEFEDEFQDFLLGIEASTNSIELDVMISAGWEEDLWVLLLCTLFIVHERDKESLTGSIVRSLAAEYGVPPAISASEGNDAIEANQDATKDGDQNDLMRIVEKARQCRPSKTSFWHNDRWSEQFIAQWGGRILRCESTMMMVRLDPEQEEETRLVVYLQPEQAPSPHVSSAAR